MIGRARYNMLMTVDNDDKYPFVIDLHNNINNGYSAEGQSRKQCDTKDFSQPRFADL